MGRTRHTRSGKRFGPRNVCKSTRHYTKPQPEAIKCPITQQTIVDAAIIDSGQVFEKSAIFKWVESNNTCPVSRKELVSKVLYPAHWVQAHNRKCDPKAFGEYDKERAAAADAAKAEAKQNQEEVTLILSYGDAVDLMAKTKMMEVFNVLQWDELKCAQLFTSDSTLDRDRIIADPDLCKAFLEFWGIALKRSLCLFYHCRYRWHTTSLRMDKMLDSALEYWELSLKSDYHTFKLVLLGNMEFLVPVREDVHAKLVYGLVHGYNHGYVDHNRKAYSMKLLDGVLGVFSGRLNECGVVYDLSSWMYVIQTTGGAIGCVPNADKTVFSLTGRTVTDVNQIKRKFNDAQTPQQLTQSLYRSLQMATMFRNRTPPVLAEELFNLDSIDALNILDTCPRFDTNVDKRRDVTVELVGW